jgi:hypothetical protein
MNAETGPATRAHFQLYAESFTAPVRWRLLSGNNRDIGRCAAEFADRESCLLGIKRLLHSLGETQSVVRRAAGNQWIWSLSLRGEPAVVSGHSYDRQIRAEHARQQFLQHAPIATVTETVMVSAARRWASQRPLDHTQHLPSGRPRVASRTHSVHLVQSPSLMGLSTLADQPTPDTAEEKPWPR